MDVHSRSDRLKVAHIWNLDVGMVVHLRPQMRALVERGADVCAICPPGEVVREDTVLDDGIRMKVIPMARSIDPASDLRLLAALARLFRRERFDVVHTHGPKQELLGRIAARIAGVPIILATVHGFYFHEATPPRERQLHIAFQRIGIACGHFVFCQSAEDLEFARSIRLAPPGALQYLGNGVNLSRFNADDYPDEVVTALRRSLGVPEDALVMGIIGRKNLDKGYREFYEAAAQLRKTCPNLRLLTLGGAHGEERSGLPSDLPERLGIADLVIDVGHTDQVPAMLAAMDVFAFPSHREGFPRALIEASAMGKAIVASNIRGSREIVVDGGTGIFVPPRDVGALADAAGRLLTDAGLRRRLGAAARARALREFDEQIYIRRLLDTYERLLGERLPAKAPLFSAASA